MEVDFKTSSNVITTTVHIVHDYTQKLTKRLELSSKKWTDVSQGGKSQAVNEIKKSDDAIYNEEC